MSSSFINCEYMEQYGYDAYGENMGQINRPVHSQREFDWSITNHQYNSPFNPSYYNIFNDYPEENGPRRLLVDYPEKRSQRLVNQVPQADGKIKNSEGNEPRSDMLQELVDQVLKVDSEIKTICNRGHNPSEEITEAYYKRTFNIEGYKPDTAIVRIKSTVLYSCLDPVSRGKPCLQDVALLPDHLIIEDAMYNIENNKLTIKIPFKENSIDLECNVCGVSDEYHNNVMTVSKENTMPSAGYSHIADKKEATKIKVNQYHSEDITKALQKYMEVTEKIYFPDN